MIGPDLVAEVANCPPGKKYELFLKYRDLFDFPAESLEASDEEDGQIRDAAEFPYVEQFSGGNSIGIQAPNPMTTNLVVPNVEPRDFASYAPRGFVPVQFDHARSLGCNQNTVFDSNGSSPGETETAVLPRSCNNTDMRKSKRLASTKRKARYEDSEWSLPQGKASRNKQPLQKKKRRMSRISYLTEVSPRAEGNKCTHCGITETTEWSEGPNGANTLCKLCGIQFRHGLFQGADMAHVAVPEMGREMSQSSASFEVQPGADKAKLGKRNQNKKMKKPKMKLTAMGNHTSKGKCTHCLVVKTTQWREGPLGRRTLCNACGLKFRLGRLYPEYRPSKSPTFVPSIHSSKHREVKEIRKRVTTMQASSSANEPAHPQSVAVKEASSSENEPTKPQSDAVKKTSSSENAQIQSQSDAAQEATTESPPALPNTNEVATVAGTGTSMSPPKDMEEAAPALSQREVPSPLVSEAAKQIEALMQLSASARAFFKLAYIVICLCEKVKMMKERLSNLPQRPSNAATAGSSMPVDSAFEEATTECVVGLVAKRVISPPAVAGGIAMAASKAPTSQCGGGSVVKVSGGGQQLKRILEKKKEKKEKKKLRKVSSEGGAKKTVPEGSSSLVPKKCLHCDSSVTPQWRNGPLGPKTLCNACGMRYRAGGLVPEYRPAKSPAFIPSLHSSSRKLVVQMRKKDTTHEGAMGVAASSVNQEAANIEMGPKTPPPPECTPTNSYSVNSESGDLCGFP